MELESIIREFAKTKTTASSVHPPKTSGVYACYLRPYTRLGDFQLPGDWLIYIGKAQNLYERICQRHVKSNRTGSSTLRRSLGAILKHELQLVAIPRGKGDEDTCCYKFDVKGEEKLTDWIKTHLEFGFDSIPMEGYKTAEIGLITKLRPLLNLDGCDNPVGSQISKMRSICINEAYLSRF
jgi:hypothetical protein